MINSRNQNSDSEIVVELLFLNPKYLCVLYPTLQPEHQTDCYGSIFFCLTMQLHCAP
jgi:hypothetical protein